jgi:hypothetical protein
VVNETNGQGSEGAEVDEGCSRVMKDRAKRMEGKRKQPSQMSSSREHHQINR